MAGRLIAIEGIDGVGKGTQAKSLLERCEANQLKACLFSFPRYSQSIFGGFIGNYLNGEFGALDSIHPLFASLLFAGDRFEAKGELVSALEEYDVVICDRYVGSNIAHQGARVPEQVLNEFIRQIESVEFDVYGLPRPEQIFYFDAPVDIARSMVRRKSQRDYTTAQEDLHESNSEYLSTVRVVYQRLCDESPNWIPIAVTEGTEIRTVDSIADDVWRVFKGFEGIERR